MLLSKPFFVLHQNTTGATLPEWPFLLKAFEHKAKCHSGSQSHKSNMRTHNEGRVVTGIESTLMQIDPQRPEYKSLLIKLFTTP